MNLSPPAADVALPASTAAPAWTARPFCATDRAAVLDLFTEPDFFFRTTQPDTLSEAEVLALVDGAHVLLADGEPVGLYALVLIGGAQGCHYQFHLRLRATAPDSWWVSAYQEIARWARWRTEVVRFSVLINEFDERYLRIARSLRLIEEGDIGRVTVRHGQRYDLVCFAQIWVPQP
jgi:hypothetical protein